MFLIGDWICDVSCYYQSANLGLISHIVNNRYTVRRNTNMGFQFYYGSTSFYNLDFIEVFHV